MELCQHSPSLEFYIAEAYQIKWLKHCKSSELTAPSSSCESFLCPRQAVRRAGRMLWVQGWVWAGSQGDNCPSTKREALPPACRR